MVKVYKFDKSFKNYDSPGVNGKVRIIKKGNRSLVTSRVNFRDIPPLLPYEVYKDFEYPLEFNWTLKTFIRQRDNLTCQVCKAKVTVYLSAVHHINYDKRDCSWLNLILLCNACHHKTSKGKRQYWYKYLYKKVRDSVPQ